MDIRFYENYIIVAQDHSIRFIPINSSEITTTISQYQNDPNGGGMQVMPSILEKTYSGILQQDTIIGMIYNHLRHEIVFVCTNDAHLI